LANPRINFSYVPLRIFSGYAYGLDLQSILGSHSHFCPNDCHDCSCRTWKAGLARALGCTLADGISDSTPTSAPHSYDCLVGAVASALYAKMTRKRMRDRVRSGWGEDGDMQIGWEC